MTTEKRIKVGCCGFAGRQDDYFGRFECIEIQRTFYQLPLLRTAAKWRDKAPEGFEFTLKAWQLITHEATSPTYRRLREAIAPDKRSRYGSFRCTDEVFEAWERTADFAATLGAEKVVFQCPASFRPTETNVRRMQGFFSQIDRHGFRLIWEPRGKWGEDLVLNLCRELDLVHGVDPFQNSPLHGDFQYFRLHGAADYHYKYSDSELEQIQSWAQRAPSYVLFNNDAMKEDALRFMELLGAGR